MAREHAGLETQEMANFLEVSRETISRWEHDRNVPKRLYLREWAKLCSIPLGFLTGELGPQTP
jgi:transcriptional regulator with XRE-family HTH domain